MIPAVNWTATATLDRVVDGDTADLIVDLPYHVKRPVRVRLLLVNTPERGKPGYREAAIALFDMLAGKKITIVSEMDKVDGFTRYLGHLYVTNLLPFAEGSTTPVFKDIHVNQWLIDEGFGIPWVKK